MTYEYDQNAEHLQHEPPVARYTGVILEKFSLSTADIGRDVHRIRVDSLYCLSLLRDHLRQLREDLAQFRDSRLDGFNCS